MIADVLVQVGVGIVFAQFEVIASLGDVTVGTTVQVVHASDVLLVLVDAVLNVLLGFGHDAVVVPAELGRDGRFVGGGFLPELAHVGLLGCGRGTLAIARGGPILLVAATCELVLGRGSRLYDGVRIAAR